jgi:hypothetical protein
VKDESVQERRKEGKRCKQQLVQMAEGVEVRQLTGVYVPARLAYVD